MARLQGVFYLLAFFIVVIDVVPGMEDVLYDSGAVDFMSWTRHKKTGASKKEIGWDKINKYSHQQTNTDPKSTVNGNEHVYKVCSFSEKSPDNWLRTTYIPRQEAKVVFITLKYNMVDCTLIAKNIADNSACKDTFDLYIWTADGDVATDAYPEWNEKTYRKISKVTGEPSHENLARFDVQNITQNGFYLAFRDRGSCITLVSLKVSYNYCPEVTRNSSVFPRTPSNSEYLQVVRGFCVPNAHAKVHPRDYCSQEGKWTNVSPSVCTCLAGFESMNNSCPACKADTFKSIGGNENCKPCPANSELLSEGGIVCSCYDGFFRSPLGDMNDDPCTQPPTAPRNLTYRVQYNQVSLFWIQPEYNGGRNDTTYIIECDCDHTALFRPSKSGIKSPEVTISHLNPLTMYTFKVSARNGVSDLANDPGGTVSVDVMTGNYVKIDNLRVIENEQNSVKIRWDAPDYDTSEIEGYKIEIEMHNHITGEDMLVKPVYVNTTSATISSLVYGYDYRVKVKVETHDDHGTWSPILRIHPEKDDTSLVYMENVINHAGHRHNSVDEGAPVNVRVVNATAYSLAIAWDPPLIDREQAEVYIVRIFYPDKSDGYHDVERTRDTFITIDDLVPGATYQFDVGVRRGASIAFGSALIASTIDVEMLKRDKARKIGIIIAGIGGFILIVVIILILLWVAMRRRGYKRCSEDRQTLEFLTNGEAMKMKVKMYVDPFTYEDPDQAIREFTREIDLSRVTIEAKIGEGEFGDVCKGKLRPNGADKKPRTVAIKTLKSDSSERALRDFLAEASIMGQFNHPNVIYLEGVVTKSQHVMIITEFMENGALDSYLRTNDGKFTFIQLVGMLRGIACGMQNLSDMGYVHRDLAARNILVNVNLVCKVADFGLSRVLENDVNHEYTTKGGKIPVRWTSPEAISYRKFTSASDVWSYGIVAWETLSYGERPYWDWSNHDVIQAIESGYKLPPPMDCPQALYQLMVECWSHDRNLRPKFGKIKESLDKLIRTPSALNAIAKPRNDNTGSRMFDVTQFQTVTDWLVFLKMERYSREFIEKQIFKLEDILCVTPAILQDMGISLVGHQKKIMNSVQEIRAQIVTLEGNGSLVDIDV